MPLQRNKYLTVKPTFYILAAIYLLLMPLKLVLSWCVAALIHEFFHYLALCCFGVRTYGIVIGANGATIEADAMLPYQEIICSLAGPVGGLITLLFSKWIPYISLCAFIQSVYNLLPIYPLDGGRALRGITSIINHELSLAKYPCKDNQQIVQ